MNHEIDFRSLTKKELANWFKELGFPAYRGRQLFRAIWRPGFRSFSELTEFPKSLREKISSLGYITELETRAVYHSVDGTAKFVLGLSDGSAIETVVIPERGHQTICISTQVGCAMGCRFCHTAKMGFHRNLTTAEISCQVISSITALNLHEKPRNIVFMGMGEPLANYNNLVKAIHILTDDHGLHYSPRRITVSTCGLVPEMLSLGRELDVGLAISLHAPDDETRNKIMPINRKYSVPKLIEACRHYPLSKRRRITFEYLLLAGINDSISHAKKLAGLLRRIPAKINLIPFNESPGLPFKTPDYEKVLAFQKILTDANYTAIIRKSKGSDISAACGQLFQKI